MVDYYPGNKTKTNVWGKKAVGLQEYPKDIKKELIENTDKQTEVKLPQHISSQLGEDKTVFYEAY